MTSPKRGAVRFFLLLIAVLALIVPIAVPTLTGSLPAGPVVLAQETADRDSDGIADPDDPCPDDSNPGCGEPVAAQSQQQPPALPDSDGDGIADNADTCPTDATNQCAVESASSSSVNAQAQVQSQGPRSTKTAVPSKTPQPSKTAVPTKTVKPSQTPAPTRTTKPTRTRVPSQTTIPTQTACVESVTANLQPGSGPQLPPTLYLDASGSSSACGNPLEYFWTCQGTNTASCTTFLSAAISHQLVTYQFPLSGGDMFNIGVQVCTTSPSPVCSLLVTNAYDGASFG